MKNVEREIRNDVRLEEARSRRERLRARTEDDRFQREEPRMKPRHAREEEDVSRREAYRAQPRHAPTEELRARNAAWTEEDVSRREAHQTKPRHARTEGLRERSTARTEEGLRAEEGHFRQGGFRMQKAYRESMRMVHPSGQFLSRLEAEMRRGLQKRRGLSPRRLLLPAAAVAAAFLLVLTLVAQQARRAGAPVSAFQPLSAATPGEVQTANAGEIRAASPSEVRSANAGETRNAAPGEIRAASPSEVRSANAGEIQTASAGEVQTASAGEIRNAASGEIQTASAGELSIATPSEGEPRRNTAMSEDEARARVLEVDRDAATAEHIFTFPCAESDGAFVVVRQTLDDATWTANGRVWYVTQTNAWLLAQKDVIWDWTLDIDNFSPEVFSICHGKDRDRSALAWIVIDGRPVEVKNAPSIYGLHSTRGALIGYAAFKDGDYAFLGVDASDPENVQFYQIEGIEITREQFLTFPGAQEVLDLVEGSGTFSIYQILYWQDSAMALNFMQGDLERTTYLYFVDGKLQCQGGWFGDNLGLASGRATAFRNLPIPVRHTRLNP